MTSAISCEGVLKRFGQLRALDDLTFEVPAGTVVGYLGPNGAGKSTTIRILLDLARPDGGKVRVLGSDPHAAGAALRRRIGYLPGELRLDDRLRVDETLRSWARLRGGVDERYVASLCERLGLDPSRAARHLSSGNRRKVGLVGAFMARPELLVLDEPTAGVDPIVQAEVLELVTEARDDGCTVFLSSHVLSEVQRVAEEVVVLRDGRVVTQGGVDDLRRAVRQEVTIVFGDTTVPVDELRAVPNLENLAVRGDEVSGTVAGDPNALLAVLARHPVRHLVLAEADLESAFLQYYQDRS